MGISTRRNPVFEAEAQGERVVRTDQFEWLARAGLLARGVVYGIIGVLAIKLALGDGGKATDQQGALHTIAKQPFGKFLLVVVAVGLAGYALWRLVRAGIGHGPEASDDIKERIDGADKRRRLCAALRHGSQHSPRLGRSSRRLERSR